MSKTLMFILSTIAGLVLGLVLLFTPIVSYPMLLILLLLGIIVIGILVDKCAEAGFCTGLILSGLIFMVLLADMANVFG